MATHPAPLIGQVQRLAPVSGDVLVFATIEPMDNAEQELSEILDGAHIPKEADLTVVLLPAGCTLDVLSERHMNGLGWYRNGHRPWWRVW